MTQLMTRCLSVIVLAMAIHCIAAVQRRHATTAKTLLLDPLASALGKECPKEAPPAHFSHDTGGVLDGVQVGEGSCCKGKHCPYDFGICCPGLTHCCPAGASCLRTNPVSCSWVGSPRQFPNNTGGSGLGGNGNGTGNGDDGNKNKVDLSKLPVIKEVDVTEAKKAPRPPTFVPRPRIPRIPAPWPKTPEDPNQKAEPEGTAWPPAGSIANTGRSGMWTRNPKGKDWRGFGLMRNGTYNRVKDMETCQDQCQIMEECRLLMYDVISKECWLDSEVGVTDNDCPEHVVIDELTNRKKTDRGCVTYFKRVQEQDIFYPFTGGPGVYKPAEWIMKEQQNWNGPNRRSLIRNGRHNHVVNEYECIKQCDRLKYCRALVYFRPNKECWLSTRVAHTGLRCAKRQGVRNCVSYIKRPRHTDAHAIRRELLAASSSKPVEVYDGEYPGVPMPEDDEEEVA